MYSDKAEKNRPWLWYTLAAVVLIALIWLFIRSAGGRENRENAAAAIREAVETSARQCYVVEGVYPPDLHYLEENYGLQINTAEFYVVYDIYASNMPPTVKVVAK